MGGISFGAMAAGDGEGGGVQGELTAGLGFGFTDQANLLVQFDLTLPFYRVSNEFGEKSYAALAVLSGGVAW